MASDLFRVGVDAPKWTPGHLDHFQITEKKTITTRRYKSSECYCGYNPNQLNISVKFINDVLSSRRKEAMS